jgi:hypothetical protein
MIVAGLHQTEKYFASQQMVARAALNDVQNGASEFAVFVRRRGGNRTRPARFSFKPSRLPDRGNIQTAPSNAEPWKICS